MAGEILDTLGKGATLAGKAAARGLSEIKKSMKGPPVTAGIPGQSGLFYRKGNYLPFGKFLPFIEFFESQEASRLEMGILRNLTLPASEKSAIKGFQNILTGNFSDAEARLGEAISKDAQLADAYYLLGCLSLENDECKEASEYIQKSILCQANFGQKLKKYLPSFHMTFSVTPNSSFALFPDLLGLNIILSIAFRELGQRDEAIKTLEQLLSVMPNQQTILFFLSCYFWEIGNYSLIVDRLKEIQPESNISILLHIMLAKAWQGIGDIYESSNVLKKVLALKEEFDPYVIMDCRFYLAQALQRAGSGEEAAGELQKVYSKDPVYKNLAERLGLKEEGIIHEAEAKPPADQAVFKPAQIPASHPALKISSPWEASLASDDGKINVKLSEKTLEIGRESGDLKLPDDLAVSKLHAKILWEDGQHWIEDAGSTNGTWVNQHRISQKVVLNKGDTIVIGETTFRVK